MPRSWHFDTVRLVTLATFSASVFLASMAEADFRGEVYALSVELGSSHGRAEHSYGQTAKIAGTVPSTGERVVLLVPRFDRLEVRRLDAGGHRATFRFPSLPGDNDPVELALDDVVFGDGLVLDPPELCRRVKEGQILVLTTDRGALAGSVSDFEDEAEQRAWERSRELCGALFGDDDEHVALWSAEPAALDVFLGRPIPWDELPIAGLYCATTIDSRCWDRGLPHGLAALTATLEQMGEPGEVILGPDLVGRLKDAGIALELPEWNTWESSPLALAIEKGAVEWVDALIAAGADLDRQSDGDSLLQLAAFWGHPEVVALLLAAGIDPDLRGDEGWTPLMTALNQGHSDVARRLIEAGADPSRPLDDGRSPLAFADDKATLRYLLRVGARPGVEAVQILHRAVEWGDRPMIEKLLELGVDVDIRGPFERTPLMTAAQEGDPRVVELLLTAGASLDLVDEFGETALRIAVDYGHPEVAGLLQ